MNALPPFVDIQLLRLAREVEDRGLRVLNQAMGIDRVAEGLDGAARKNLRVFTGRLFQAVRGDLDIADALREIARPGRKAGLHGTTPDTANDETTGR